MLLPFINGMSIIFFSQELEGMKNILELFSDQRNWDNNKFIIDRKKYSIDDYPTPADIAKKAVTPAKKVLTTVDV